MVGLKVEMDFYPVGDSEFFLSFFDNIHYHLENGKVWGSEYPILLNELYHKGKIRLTDIDNAIEELTIVKKRFKQIPPNKVIWDINNLSKQPPWGNDISDEITDLSNYFVTSDGRDLINLMFDAFEMGKVYKWDVIIWNMFKPMDEQPKPDQLAK